MSKPRLLFAMPQVLAHLDWAGLMGGRFAVTIFGKDAFDPAAIDYLISFSPPAGLLARLVHLKAAISPGVGVDGYFHEPFPPHLPLYRMDDISKTRDLAQYVLMQVLVHHRRYQYFLDAQAVADWREALLPRQTPDTRIGIMGLGHIGGFIAHLFVELGFSVGGWSQGQKNIPGVKSFAGAGELGDFLAVSDVLVCVLPLTAQTQGILNRKAFAALPQGALLVNVARGQHVVVADLIAALDSGHLAGAVLDVFETEPLPKDSPLWRHPKIAVTPHVASITQPQVLIERIADVVGAIEAGRTPTGRVDIAKQY